MSIAVMARVWETDLPASEKLVLLALADRADDDGLCWPSVDTLAKKCGKSVRAVQGSIKALVELGHLTRVEVKGKGCRYTCHPRSNCTPAKSAPPQKTTRTPADSAPNTSRTINKPNKGARAKPVASPIPDDWQPKPFGKGSQARVIVDGWPVGRIDTEAERFRCNHRSKGNMFADWQAAWGTWVNNTVDFDRSRQGGKSRQSGNGGSGLGRTADAALAAFGDRVGTGATF